MLLDFMKTNYICCVLVQPQNVAEFELKCRMLQPEHACDQIEFFLVDVVDFYGNKLLARHYWVSQKNFVLKISSMYPSYS